MTRTVICLVALLAAAAAADAQHSIGRPHEPPHGAVLSEAGQAAFGALSEVVALLEQDPSTDWSKVDVGRLREHLLDMDAVMMRATAQLEESGDSVKIAATGTGRALHALQRMIPAHAGMMDGYRGWRSRTELTHDGVVWIVTTASASERARIRALGLFGLLTLGSHHGPHHLALARGERIAAH